MDFSFIIPVYNCAEHLTGCVDSILAAGVSGCEILLIDDGSTDGSGALCDSLARSHSQIRVLHQKNSGVCAARNAGISAARGEYLLFADADDTLDPVLLRDILLDPRVAEADLTIFGMTFDYYHNGQCYRSDPLFFEEDGFLPVGYWQVRLADLFEKNALSAMWNKVYRRALITDHQLMLNPSMFLYEDLEFVLRYLSCCGRIWNVPKAVYQYRQSEDEGNAGRRLARVSHIPELLEPIEKALHTLLRTHSQIPQAACQRILQQLHLTLAREKIAVSGIRGIRSICRDYRNWEERTIPEPLDSPLRRRLLKQQALLLWLLRIKTRIRHSIAVSVKYALHRIRSSASPRKEAAQ